ncbi:MAG TPA: hypothetical protein VF158_08835 [Longimicrobiales bacterium]
MSAARPAARPPVAPLPGGLAAANAPPFRLPGEHFAAALAFWGAGAAGLVWIAPSLAEGLFPLPRVIAVTHLFTLGWITTSILGALYQFFPVALRVPVRSQRLAHASFLLFVPGLGAFVAGLVAGAQVALLAGAAAFATGLLLFLCNLAATLARVRERDLSWWSLAAAGSFLLATIGLGLALAGNLRWGYLGEHRFLALGLHLHVAIAGWVLMVVIGVARHLLPMFLLSHGAGERAGKTAAALVAGGVFTLALLHHVLPMELLWVATAAIGAGAAAFLVQTALYFRHRMRPKLDPGMRLAGVALGVLGVALLLAPAALRAGVGAPRLATAYVATLVLGFGLFVAAHYYKILPFLVWYHRFGPLAGKRPVPRVAELYGERTALAAAALLVCGTAGLVAATLAGAGAAARAAAAVYAAGAGIEIFQMAAIARRRPE